eukprot:TRINITY_DN1027_c0_g1_i1.p1 TRINITY_DN1027_c0_g1~~TRINITY_DN1027_c0_g1_i1.p1  ORF type:complete len:743 (-),score=219.96 TRINITY_DN1027_c0_g1_i1:58-2238(-)
MDTLIPVINKLQDVLTTVGGSADAIDLPQIVVVGSQSSGKSSVLENIVGKDFLPRGSGIVTRRPLVLQLIHLSESRGEQEWGEFLHKPNEQFTDFTKIRDEISRETDRLTGRNKGISYSPINLKIYSTRVLNLTLVDLPGITRVPVGDQPQDIEVQIKKMILQYISKPNAIILAVTAANTDIANSDALQLARTVDPDGRRTIGVITKIDLMDRGTNAVDVLQGKDIPLSLGYIGVINRSQSDINTNKSIKDSLKAEQEYFSSHPLYRGIMNKLGTQVLSKTLNKILMNHIKDALPDLKSKLNKRIAELQNEMSGYGNPLYDGKHSQGAILLSIITKFSNDYKNSIEGKSSDYHSSNELYGGARINYIFTEIFIPWLYEINPTDGMTMESVRVAIRNATGPRASLFVPEEAFELMVIGQIAKLEEPALECVDRVFEELTKLANQIENKEMQRFRKLRERIEEVVLALLNKCRNPARLMIGNLISIEKSFINTNHPDFTGGSGALVEVFSRMAGHHPPPSTASSQNIGALGNNNNTNNNNNRTGMANQIPQSVQNVPQQSTQFFNKIFGGAEQPQPGAGGAGGMSSFGAGGAAGGAGTGQKRVVKKTGGGEGGLKLAAVPQSIRSTGAPTERERFETELILSMLNSYFSIVRKNVQDQVPKSIMHFLVNQSKDLMQNELVANLYKEELFDELLEENAQVAERRRACKSLLDTLTKAQSILSEVREITV